MRTQTTLLLLASAVCLAVALAACGSSGETDGTTGDMHDPAACGCHVDGQVLTMSWECYCDRFGCGSLPTDIRCNVRSRIDYPGCGLTVFRQSLPGGPADMVYDGSGALVGASTTSDTSDYTCPTDSSLKALQVRAGVFPEASCEARSCAVCSATEAFPCAAAP
jgi:hypothetical protein